MTWKRVNGLYVRDGHLLEPRTPDQVSRDSYRLGEKVLASDPGFGVNPPLIIPLTRGGEAIYSKIVSVFRGATKAAGHGNVLIRYVPIEVKRYNEGEIGSPGSRIYVNDIDARQARHALDDYDVGLIVDDVMDKGRSIDEVKKMLLKKKKKILVAVLDKKCGKSEVETDVDFWVNEHHDRKIGGVMYPTWVVYDWERDEHPPELWSRLFPMLDENPSAWYRFFTKIARKSPF